MLYIIHRSNHRDLDYNDGQDPIVHLELDLNKCIQWADKNSMPWALSTGNAGATYADFYGNRKDFVRIDWNAVANRDFSKPSVKEGKQAEFLVRDTIPWALVEHVGVFDQNRLKLAKRAIAADHHQPTISIENGWYF